MAKEARGKVDYGKIAGAVSGRSLAMIDPTIATRRAHAKREAERQSNIALAGVVSSVASGVGSLSSAVGKNLESWSELESGLKAVGGEASTLKDAGLDKSWLKKAFTAAPSGGQMAVTQGDVTRVFSGTELSDIGKAVQGGYQSSLIEPGSSLFETYGGSLKMAEAGQGSYGQRAAGQIATSTGAVIGTDPYWNPKGTFEIGEWGVGSSSRLSDPIIPE